MARPRTINVAAHGSAARACQKIESKGRDKLIVDVNRDNLGMADRIATEKVNFALTGSLDLELLPDDVHTYSAKNTCVEHK